MTLQAELNRLANGGASYPPRDRWWDAQKAANLWAGTTGLDLQGALNVKAGVTNRYLWLDIDGVCNDIAGTDGLTAIAALEKVVS